MAAGDVARRNESHLGESVAKHAQPHRGHALSGIGLLETTNVSVGRGTNTPFEVVGAPWIDGQQLAAYLNSRRIAGVRFVPVRFTPQSSVFKDEECGGINVIITERARFRPVINGLEIAVALRKLYPTQWKVDSYARLLVNSDTLEKLKRGDSAEQITRYGLRSWKSFAKRERPFCFISGWRNLKFFSYDISASHHRGAHVGLSQ